MSHSVLMHLIKLYMTAVSYAEDDDRKLDYTISFMYIPGVKNAIQLA